MSNTLRVPKLRRHKSSGRVVVTLNGRDFYLGPWGAKQSRAEYNRLVGEWLAGGGQLPVGNDLTVAELCLAYWRYAKTYYRVKPGGSRGSIERVKLALHLLRSDYGHTLAADFGPLSLLAIQQKLAESGKARTYVNDLVQIIKQVFKRATSLEMIPVGVYAALATLAALKKGRSPAREPEPVQPVADEVVEATLVCLPAVVADMVRFQRLTGARPGEVCILRPCDVDTSTPIWSYRPQWHKTEHHNRKRIIYIGPKAQDVLRPYLLRDKEGYCFSPADSERKRSAARRENRKTPTTPSQRQRRRKRNPKCAPGDRYTCNAYRQAITRAIDKANRAACDETMQLPYWVPNQLRHTAATAIRRQYGLEAVQCILGHAHAKISEIYAEKDGTLAAAIMAKVG